MHFFSQKLSFRLIVMIFSVVVISGCAGSYPTVDPYAKAVPVKVVGIDSEYNIWGGSYWASRFMTTVYTVVDSKGRTFKIKALGHPKKADFQVGQCVSMWRASNILNSYYPRLSGAAGDCNIINSEPEKDHYYSYRLNEETCLERKLDSWLDSPVERLTANWGEPNEKYYENNHIVMRYYEDYTVTERHSRLRFGHGKTTKSSYSCDIKFYVDDKNVIAGYSWKGNNCR